MKDVFALSLVAENGVIELLRESLNVVTAAQVLCEGRGGFSRSHTGNLLRQP
jgi:hypothetical protein